jgi:hypothetical protein
VRKLLLAILIILCGSNLYAAYAADVIAVWEDSDTDIINSYVMTDVNTGGTWATNPLTPPHGDNYYFTSYAANFNWITFTAQDAMNTATEWTIQWDGWLPTKGAGTTAGSDAWFWGRLSNNAAGSLWFRIITNQWNVIGKMDMNYDGNYSGAIGAFSATLYPDGVAGNRWCQFQFCFKSGVYKFYMDGALIYESAGGKNNLFDTVRTMNTTALDGNMHTYYKCDGMDRIIFSTKDYAGTAIDPLPDNSPTPTFTKTHTLTSTLTPTMTFTTTWTLTETPSVTKTITPTWTPTITQTITPTWTPTITPTATPTNTPWPDYILNAPKTKDIHYQGPVSRWYNWLRRKLTR